MVYVDVRTDDGLRDAIRALTAARSWDSPLGRLVLEQFRQRASLVAYRVCVQAGADTSRAELADDIVGRLWEAVTLRPQDILTAASPWKVVVTILVVAARGELLARAFGCNARSARRYVTDTYREPARIGAAALCAVPARPIGGQRWDVALAALHSEIVCAGAPAAVAAESIDLVVDLLGSSTRRSWVHTRAYQDERLCRLLTRAQIRAMVDLLIGSRREGPAGSAWLALREATRHGRDVRLAEVHPRSLRRVHVLVQPWVASHPAVAAR